MLGIAVAYVASQRRAPLLPIYGTLSAFILTNQDNNTFSLADLRGQVWIADAIFTRCPGQCLLMSGHMKAIQDLLPAGAPIRLVSFTTDPDYDQPPVLKKYAERFGAQEDRWSFLTGGKATLHNVEVNGLKLPVLDKPAAEREGATDLFIHSEKFVLLDKMGRIRAYYDGQNADVVAEIVSAAQALARE